MNGVLNDLIQGERVIVPRNDFDILPRVFNMSHLDIKPDPDGYIVAIKPQHLYFNSPINPMAD